jgi:transcriptional regulator with XRE-family HTH domain
MRAAKLVGHGAMAITDQELGRRLRAARKACGMTQADVGRELGVSRGTITQIEAGSRLATALELGKLSFLYGRRMGEFLASTFVDEAPSSALLRSAMRDPRRGEQLAVLRAELALGHELRNLHQLLSLPGLKAGEFGDALRQQVVTLGLEALRREEISRRKFHELARLAGVSPEREEQILCDAGLDPASELGDVLIPTP